MRLSSPTSSYQYVSISSLVTHPKAQITERREAIATIVLGREPLTRRTPRRTAYQPCPPSPSIRRCTGTREEASGRNEKVKRRHARTPKADAEPNRTKVSRSLRQNDEKASIVVSDVVAHGADTSNEALWRVRSLSTLVPDGSARDA